MFARIVTYKQADPSPHRIEEALRRTWERLPGVRELDGIEGAYFFVDRHSGKAIFLSLWESEQAMKRSDELMRPLRAELTGAFAAKRVDVEHFEVRGDARPRDTRARASRTGARGSPNRPASQPPQGGAHPGRLEDRSLLPAS